MFEFLKRHARHENVVLEDRLRPFVARAVHLYAYLSADDQRELEHRVAVFLLEKAFEGAGGLTMTDEIRVTIAAQACLLQLHRKDAVYPDLETIVVYPRPYVVHAAHREGPVVIEGPETRLGESWQRGLVVLAWDEVARDARVHGSGRNVVFHEFAHQLDAADGSVDGAPKLGSRDRYRTWSRVLGEEYQALGERLHAGLPSDIDAYAATNPPEFFAVVTEAFFERPDLLRARHPELYEELRTFYELDPAALLNR